MTPSTVNLPDLGEARDFDVAVIGGGIGLILALAAAEQGQRVVLFSDRPTGSTTLFRVAAGLGEPIASDDDRVGHWFARTRQWVFDHPNRQAWGMALRRVRLYGKTTTEVSPSWADAVGGVTVVQSDHPGWSHASEFDTFVIQPDIAHAHIRELLGQHGVDIHESVEFADERDALSHPIVATATKVIIATGIGMNPFLPKGRPISAGFGYVVRTQMTDETDTIVRMTSDLTYMIPQVDHVVWGGSLVEGDADEVSVMSDHEDVHDKLRAFDPRWPVGKKVAEYVGARPLAARIILEEEHRDDQVLVRVGGLGGSGWTLSFGIISEVMEMLGLKPPHLGE